MLRTWPPRPTAPTDPGHRDPTARPDRRREPTPLDQLPAWRELVPVMDPVARPRRRPGMEALLGGLDPDQLRAVTHDDGPLLVVAGAGTGKTQVITRRIAWLIATRRARPSEILALTFTDKAAEEMAVRVDQLVPYGYTDTRDRDVPRVRRPAHPRVRARARPADRRPRPVPRRGRHLPARAPVRVRARRVPAARRPDPVPGRAGDAVQPLQGRGHRAGGLRRARGPRRGRGRVRSREARPGRTTARRRVDEEARRQAELARAYASYQDLMAANGCIDFGDQVALALRLVRSRRPRGATIAGRFRYILVDEFQDTNRAQAELVAALAEGTGTSPSSATTTRRSTRSAAPRSTTSSSSRTATSGHGPSSCAGTTARSRRSSTPPTGSSGSTTRTGSRSGPASSSGCAPQRVAPAAAPVRLEAFAHGFRGGRLDRRRDRASDRGRGRRRATTPSSSARTATPTRSCGRSTWPASRGGSPGPPGCTPDPRSGCCWRSCGSSPTPSRASTCTRWRRRTSTGSAART